jgi:ABC-2 type transport system ATP-binding protein
LIDFAVQKGNLRGMSDLPQYAIEISNLTKVYPATAKSPIKAALQDVSLKIPRGSIYGLLGPNGAGKSTLINTLAGLVVRSAGNVKIWGRDIHEDVKNAKSAIGVVPQEINYDPFFTPARLLDIQAGLYGVPKAERRTAELLEMVGLSAQANAYTRSLSGGMKRRLMVAKAMVHSPPILVLDEPTAGVDVELRQQLWDNVKALNKRGVTVLLTTHYLQEAEELCDRIAIINHGKIVVDDETEVLLSRIEAKEIHFRLDRAITDLPESLQKFNPERQGNRTLVIRYAPTEHSAGEIIAAVQGAGYGIADLSTQESNLEDLFLHLTKGK